MSATTACPSCNKALPATVLSGPAQAVVRCEGCQTLLLWSNGRVMRSAKSATPTMMGMPAVKVPAAKEAATKEAEAPLPELKPEADAVPVTAKSDFPKPPPAKTPPPRSATQPLARVQPQKSSVTGIGDSVPTKVVPASAELRKESARKDKDPTPPPMKVPPSGPMKLPPPAAPSAKATTTGMPAVTVKPAPVTKPAAKAEPVKGDSGKSEAPHVVAAVAQVPQLSTSGDMVDPSAWFAGDVSEVVPAEKVPATESPKPLPAESTGIRPAPLPPPPAMGVLEEAEPFEIEPFGEEKTPAVPISMTDVPSGPIAMHASMREPSQRIAVAPPPKPVAREPSQKIATPPAPVAVKEPSQKIATVAPATTPAAAPAAAPAAVKEPSQKIATAGPPAKKSASSIRGADPLVPALSAAATKDLPNVGTAIGKAPEPPPGRATVMGRPAMEMPKPAEPLSAAIDLLPPSPASTPVANAPLVPERADATPVKVHEALVNVPAPVTTHEPSVEALPPPPATPSAEAPIAMGLEATSQTVMPPVTSRVRLVAVPRRLLFIVGGAASGVIVLVLIVVALSRGGTPTPPTPPTPKVATPPAPKIAAAPKPTPTPPAPTPIPAPTPTPPPLTVAPAPPPTTPETAEAPTPAPTPPHPTRPKHTLGGKKVVLEYDPKPTSPAPATSSAPIPKGEDPATLARAREAYHKGNVKLFAGDSAGAIVLYRESLKIYPGYVAGYRGLGLGYEAAGNTDEALKAFHTYVRTVPSATDTPIIRRRIERLETQKPSAQ